MTEIITSVNNAISNLVWGVPAMVLILGVGLYLSIRLGFIQFRKFGYAMKNTVGKAFQKTEKKPGSVSPFTAMCTALAATVGTGNIAGVSGAIAIGGPGAVFWMWMSALVGMVTKYAEVTLSIRFRERNAAGDWVGGPMYYIKNGLGTHWRWLAVLFCLFGSLAAFGIGNMTQVNTIAGTIHTAISTFTPVNAKVVAVVVGVILMVIVGFVLLGGIQRIGNVCTLLVPIMAIIYIVAGLVVIVANAGELPAAFRAIFVGAFRPSAAVGGMAGYGIAIALRKGVSRGIFSNEAGLGSAPIAHAAADVDDPCKQGLFGIFEVFADTLVICTLTALVVLCGNGVNNIPYGTEAGSELTISGMQSIFGSGAASVIVAIGLTLFALSTVLTWGLYGSRCFEYLFGTKAVRGYQIVFVLMVLVGTTMKLSLAWGIAETLNGLMAIPNLIALLVLSPVVIQLSREHFSRLPRHCKKH